MAGVDGVPGGWVVALVDGGRVRWQVVPDAPAVLAATAGCVAVAVDIPLRTPTGAEPRSCDVAAARALGRSRSSVFPAPPHRVLTAPDYAQACAVARRLTGRAISVQTWNIGPKILEWDGLDLPPHIVEAHPELAVRRLAPDVEFASKKTARGAGQRIAALGRWLDVAAALGELPSGARMDDVLDALAAAWSAARWQRGEAEVLGGGPDGFVVV